MALTLNPVLASLDLKPTDRIISIKENGNIDGNFIIAHIIKQAFQEDSKLCLVTLHNTLGHYQNLGKRLGYDIVKKVQENEAYTIEPLKDLAEEIGDLSPKDGLLNENKELIIKELFNKIKTTLDSLAINNNKRIYLIIDDLSHLLDLGVDLHYVINFTSYCLSLINNDRICVVISTHISKKSDEIVSNNLNYVADINIEVLPLKTGYSNDVSGLMIVNKIGQKQPLRFHFKAYDKGIRTFHFGESLYNLYK